MNRSTHQRVHCLSIILCIYRCVFDGNGVNSRDYGAVACKTVMLTVTRGVATTWH